LAISAARVRTSVPWFEISMMSCAESTCTAPTNAPLRALVWIAITPWVPRPFFGYSSSGVRLPKPFALAVRMSPSPVCHDHRYHQLAFGQPHAAHAGRGAAHRAHLASSKRTTLPLLANSSTSRCRRSVRIDQRIALVQVDRDLAARQRYANSR
jgi:hypothetical protein